MRNLIKFITIIIASFVYFGVVLFFHNKSSAQGIPVNLVQTEKCHGEVLGINEYANDLQISDSTIVYGFPKNAYKKIAPSKKKQFSNKLKIESPIAIVIDKESSEILFEKNIKDKVPIASITKLITALVILDLKPDWDEIYKIDDNDRINGGKIFLYKGDEVRIKDLFYLSLVASANTATKALVNSTGLSEEEFVAKMNDKMKSLAKIVRIAFSKNENKTVLLKKDYTFKTKQGKLKKAVSTDKMLTRKMNFKSLGGKTGFTEMANYCFVGRFANNVGNEVISVVLGGEYIDSRFDDSEKIVNWVYENYIW